ncbi:MAG: hypothetical protein A2538_01425 [Candidatus Magasanikbacteria bacterium RIFOXYD2_FULL_41_14]|uniref:Uncharacterized protein n=1 Tax=Candidatus Magasanikbacteria bacterium RIFOXYD2_FULL_41_14 TaxID=1798709 RepID=A0A1F6PDF0_9BACT|nr:MAG: hypothetical protein A2538_01425 [Candidatus Magasanikbacteria bacterium RIFOXYD2_FULL_41_14]
MRINFVTKTKLIVAAFTLVTAGIIFGTILPTTNTIKTISQQTDDLKTFIEKKYQGAIKQRQSTEQINETKFEADRYAEHIYHKGSELQLITYFENMASKNNLTQNIQAPNLDKPENKIINISLSLNGSYSDTLQYLSDLESAPYFFVINQLQISNASERQKQSSTILSMVNTDIDLQLYAAQ